MQARWSRLTMVAVLAAASWPVVGTGTPAWAQGGPGWEVHITGASDVLMAFDTATKTQSPTPVSTACGGPPGGVAITPDALVALVACPTAGEVVAVDLASGSVAGITVSPDPAVIAITPDGSLALVNSSSTELSVIDIAAGTVDTITLSSPATDIVISPDGATAYVAAGASVIKIDLTTGSVVGVPIGIGGGPRYLAMAPDGAIVYVATMTGNIIPITTADNMQHPGILSGLPGLGGIAITPDGTKLYVSQLGGPGIAPVDLSGTGGTAKPAINAGATVVDLAVAPDGATVYAICSGPDQIVPIPTASDSAEPSIALSAVPIMAAVTPDQAPVARLSATPPQSPVVFDASTSTVMFGTIVRYDWDFGDGTTATTTTPVVSHEYASFGTYTATVTLTSSGGTSLVQVFTGQTLSRNGGPLARTSVTVTYTATAGISLPVTGPRTVAPVVPVAAGAALLIVGLVMLRLGRRRR